MTQFVNRDNANRGQYAKVIADIAAEKICPFCSEHIHRIHPKPLKEKTFWLVTENAYPYSPVKQHLLFIHKEHVEHLSELSVEAWQELQEIFKEECKKRDIRGGAIVLRFGDTHFTGASVSHLHAQLVQGDPDSPEYEKTKGVTCRIG